ncbi:hypothetical protein BsWGS_19270 [Bradybaena similaris]
MFNLIHELLSHSNSSDRLLQSAAFLLACSVAGNNKGQLLANESGCLQDLVNLLRGFMTSGSEDEDTWSSVIRAIGVCISNPQNAHNQQICCSMLPHTLKFVSTEFQHKCLSHVLTLISSVVANNVPNQNRIRRCGGIEMLINFIRYQIRVEITPWSLSLLVNAVSAVDACIADNEECELQAGTLGLVRILLDLLQIKNLELSQVQVFMLTLAHVLESSNEHCQLVSEGRGYYTLVNYLTDCQDEELFKVIKYILTLCKAQGVHELSDGQQHNGVQKEDYDGGHNRSQRDLTAFLKEGLTALSNQLNSIEKISTGIQWMTNANMTAQPLDSFRSSNSTLGNRSYIDQMPPHCTLRDKTGSLNIVEWDRQNSFPLHKSLNNDMECQELEIIKNGSLASDIRKPDSEIRQVFQNSSFGNSVHTKHDRIIRPQDGEAEMIKMAGVGSNCRQVQNVGTDTPMKPSHGSSTQTQNGYHLASSCAHVSGAHNSRRGDSEHVNCNHSNSKCSSSHSPVPHFPDVQVIAETISSTDQNLEANLKNDLHEDRFRTIMPQQENQLYLLSQLQKVMSHFFKSLLPQQWKADNHPSSAARQSGGQCQNVPERVGSPSSQCKSILSLCEENGLRDEDQHQMSHTCLSATKQTLTNPSSKLTNNSVILQPENDNLPDIHKDDHIQSVYTSSNSKNGSGLRDKLVDSGDGVGDKSVKTSASERIVDESRIFIKPSQPCFPMSRAAVRHKAASNIRLAGTPSTPLSVHTAYKTPTPQGPQPPCSPALSLFDSRLKSMAYRGTTGACVAIIGRKTFSQKPDDSTSGFESTGTAEAIAKVGSAWSPESKRDGQTCETSTAPNQLWSAGLPTSRSPISSTKENCLLQQDSMQSLSTHQSFCNQFNHTQSQCITNSARHKRKSAACIQEAMNKKKKDPAECGPQYSKSSLCPGCGTSLNLNSCTYNIAIEACPYTCAYHRHVRQCERTFINQLPVIRRTHSEPKKRPEDKMATGATTTDDVYEFQSGSEEPTQVSPVRRPVTSKQNNAKVAKQTEQTTVQLPFSLCEIRRLKNGVKHLGYNWRAILRSYKFLPGRTAADLHSEWRSLNRVESFSDDMDS